MGRAAYVDASAIVKLAVPEPESLALVDYLHEPRRRLTRALSLTEAWRGLRRAGAASPSPAGLLEAFHLVGLDERVLTKAATVDPPTLRPLDAIHLASALSLEDTTLDFVTCDDRLADAARVHGLRVVQPGRH